MRIFYVLNSRWPTIKAHGLQVAKTCQGLVQAGESVTLVVPRRSEYQETQGIDPFVLYGIRERFQIVWLPSLDTVHGTFLFVLQQIFFALLTVGYLLFKKGTVYTRDPFTAAIFSMLGRRTFWEAHRFPRNPRSLLYRLLFSRVAGIIVITECLKNLFIKAGVSTQRLAVIPDAVDPDEFNVPETTDQARIQFDLPRDRKIIGYVGQLSTFGEDKGVSDLLRAFKIVRSQHPEALLLIVGGNQKDIEHYRYLASELGLSESDVVFVGQQSHERVPLYLRACDVLVMPYPNTTHYAYYMSPLKLFEYMAAGKPIVTTDLPSIREIVSDDDVFFVEPNSANSLAGGISRALAQPTEAQKKISRIHARISEYSWQQRARKIKNFIEYPWLARICFVIPERHMQSGWGRYADDVINGARSSGHSTTSVEMRNFGISFVFAFGELIWKARSADIIYAIDGWPFGVLAWIVSRIWRKNLIIGAIGTYTVAPLYQPIKSPLVMRAYRDADAVVSISRYTAHRLQNKVPQAKVHIITPGVLTEQWSVPHQVSERPTMLSVGALKPRKGYRTMLEAFALARQRVPELQWVIVGGRGYAKYVQSLLKRAEELGVRNAITMHEHISDEELRSIYAHADLFILLSENQGNYFEGFGIVFLEAATAGLPVIGTRGNGIEDAIGPANGILVAQQDVHGAADAITILITDQERRRMMSQASREWARQHQLDVMYEAHEEIYRKISGRM